MNNENVNNGTQVPDAPVTETGQPQAAPERKPDPPKSGQAAQPKKELTPAELQKRKKMLVMPLIFLVFAAAMWFIFAPSDKDKKQAQQGIGFNADLPMPKDGGLIGDKKGAYEQEAMKNKEQEKMRSLQDFSFTLGEAEAEQSQEEQERQSKTAPKPPDYYEKPTGKGSSRPSSGSSVQSSVNAYQDINKQLGAWYDQPATGEDEQSKLAVESRIQELEGKLDEETQRKRAQEEQLQFMEKSYQMAAKYMPQQQGAPVQNPAGRASSGTSGKTVVQPVKQVRQSVVSLLSAPMDNAEFAQAYSKPRNLGFLTAAGNEGMEDKNTIRACVYQTITLTTGKELQIRLLEPMRAGDILIPANTVVTGACRITGERMDVTINSIQYADNIIPVELLIYDTDGQRGIFVPGNDEVKAAKEVASTLANSAGSSIMISDNAGSQLAADMGKGLIQGTSQYVSKKMSVVKITLKANYRILLLPKTQ
jgi:conjugative transposon TraM protein